jgi:hypothetical protein
LSRLAAAIMQGQPSLLGLSLAAVDPSGHS